MSDGFEIETIQLESSFPSSFNISETIIFHTEFPVQ